MEVFGWEDGDGSVGMGGWGWDRGDGSVGMGAWDGELFSVISKFFSQFICFIFSSLTEKSKLPCPRNSCVTMSIVILFLRQSLERLIKDGLFCSQ